MTAPALTAAPEQTGAEVMLLMLDHGIQHVPVVTARSEVLGVIRDVDLLAAQTGPRSCCGARSPTPASGEQLGKIVDQLNLTVVSLAPGGAGPGADQLDHLGRLRRRDPPHDRDRRRAAGAAAGRVRRGSRSAATVGARRSRPRTWTRACPGRTAPDGPEGDAGVHARDRRSRSRSRWRSRAGSSTPTASPPRGSSPPARSRSGAGRSATWLNHPEDEKVLIATSILLDGRTVFGSDELDPKGAVLRGRGPGDAAALDAAAGALP